MGNDKYENEHLIKWGWPCDIWFHVDDLSSAHVYLRLPRGPHLKTFRETNRLDHLPQVLEECVQLVKANSIEGCKQNKVAVVYTPWENLRKTGSMAVGQVGFRDQKKVISVPHVEKDREVINRLNKTKVVEDKSESDFQSEREEFDRMVLALKREKARQDAKEQQRVKAELVQAKHERDYERIFEKGKQNMVEGFEATEDAKAAVAFEEDFM